METFFIGGFEIYKGEESNYFIIPFSLVPYLFPTLDKGNPEIRISNPVI